MAADSYNFLQSNNDLLSRQTKNQKTDIISDILQQLEKDIITSTILMVSIIVLCIIIVFVQPSAIAYTLGYTSLGSISFIAGYITLLTLKADLKYAEKVKQYGSEEAYAEALSQECEEKERDKEQKRLLLEKRERELAIQKEHDKAAQLLEEIGTKFFIKHYNKLQTWSIPDILDEIEENYSEESKLNRIRKAKKLFELKLNNAALEIISNNESKTTDKNTREKALQLLEQTKSTDV